jgi:hypothetical protein
MQKQVVQTYRRVPCFLVDTIVFIAVVKVHSMVVAKRILKRVGSSSSATALKVAVSAIFSNPVAFLVVFILVRGSKLVREIVRNLLA